LPLGGQRCGLDRSSTVEIQHAVLQIFLQQPRERSFQRPPALPLGQQGETEPGCEESINPSNRAPPA